MMNPIRFGAVYQVTFQPGTQTEVIPAKWAEGGKLTHGGKERLMYILSGEMESETRKGRSTCDGPRGLTWQVVGDDHFAFDGPEKALINKLSGATIPLTNELYRGSEPDKNLMMSALRKLRTALCKALVDEYQEAGQVKNLSVTYHGIPERPDPDPILLARGRHNNIPADIGVERFEITG